MKSAVLTGGTGMLGLALVRLLVKKNIKVLILVRPGSGRKSRIPDHSLVNVLECDLNNLDSLTGIDEKYDAFFHFGWEGTYGDTRNDMYLQNRNVKNTIDAVHLAHKLGCTVFVGAGSQAEYGRVADGVKIAPELPTFPENGYGISKLCAGQMSRIECKKLNIKHVWTRILSTYGPYDGMQTMVMSGIVKMLSGQRPQYTKGEQMWDYLYCDDAANAFYLAAEKGKDQSIYCIGSGNVRPLRDYITTIRDTVNPGGEIGFGEVPYFDKQVMYLCADITSLTEDTGFIPQVSFEDGIQYTVDWYKKEVLNK
ncbi:MAG: NAD(P)-dependent oxidoreductase [Clostridia bacterium]|nr:NAD(P)-dependent oxidoreductase [Clostridia bacterium]